MTSAILCCNVLLKDSQLPKVTMAFVLLALMIKEGTVQLSVYLLLLPIDSALPRWLAKISQLTLHTSHRTPEAHSHKSSHTAPPSSHLKEPPHEPPHTSSLLITLPPVLSHLLIPLQRSYTSLVHRIRNNVRWPPRGPEDTLGAVHCA